MLPTTHPDGYDVAVVGAGLVGSSLVCALAALPLRLVLLDSQALWATAGAASAPDDPRAIALSYGSRQIFSGIGVWDELSTLATPIHHIHVSERGQFGFTRLHREDAGLEALGYVLGAAELGRVLHQRVQQTPRTECLDSAQVTAVHHETDAVRLDYQRHGQPHRLRARLLVAADGGQSSLRTALGVQTEQRAYDQYAVIASVRSTLPHHNTAYERFSADGPSALLPLAGARQWALVWTAAEEALESVLGLDDAAFLQALQQRFGWRVGRFLEVGPRRSFPLNLVRTRDPVGPRSVVLGNAAHTLHPVAGQGLNLGLRDVAALAEQLAAALGAGEDVGGENCLRAYRQRRDADMRETIGITDGLVRLFGAALPPLRLARNLGLLGLDLCPPLKRGFLAQTTGLRYAQPRLARGLSLLE